MKSLHVRGILFALSTSVSLLFAPAVRSQVVQVYNSFGPGNSYNTAIAWGIEGTSTANGYRGQAQFFVPGTSGYLDQILLETTHVSGFSNLGNLYIAQDNGSGIPGSILESWLNVAHPNGSLLLTSTTPVLLQAGQTYWLCDEPAAANTSIAWYQNNQNISPGDAYDNSEWSWNTIPAGIETAGVFALTVTSVPEPSTVALFSFSFLVVGFNVLKVRKIQPAAKS